MFDFSRFHKVASLLAKYDGEEFVRSAIGRYYYALFSSARQYLVETRNEFQFLNRNDIHNKVYKRFIKSSDSTEFFIGEILNELREIRNNADYDWLNGDTVYYEENLQYIMEVFDEALESLESLKLSPPFELNY